MSDERLSIAVIFGRGETRQSIFVSEAIRHLASHYAVRVMPSTEVQPGDLAGTDVVVDVARVTPTTAWLDGASSLRLWHVMGTGFNHLPMELLERQGIGIANCPGWTGAAGVAEHALMLTLMLVRGYERSRQIVSELEWERHFGTDLNALTVAVVGYGATGKAFSSRCAALGMRVIVVNRSGDAPEGTDSQLEFFEMSQLGSALARADVVSLHLPLTEDTRHILDRDRLGELRSGGYVVNVARGGLIDEDALCDRLTDGSLGGAGLDVFESEPLPSDHRLRQMNNVILTPHVAGNTLQTATRRAELIAVNCERLERGESLMNLVGNG